MRELTVRIRYTQLCLGYNKGPNGNMLLPRDAEDSLIFMPSWHKQNMKLASQIYGQHQKSVRKILWDPKIDVVLREPRWHKRTYTTRKKKAWYVLHEAIFPGQLVGINCLVPAAIDDDELIALMNLAGKYKGLSPFKPGEFGRFTVDRVLSRREVLEQTNEQLTDK